MMKYKNKLLVFVISLLVFFPFNDLYATNAYKSVKECQELGGEATSPIRSKYRTYVTVCKDRKTGATETSYTQKGTCSGGKEFVSRSEEYYWASSKGELNMYTGLPAASWTEVESGKVCCEWGNGTGTNKSCAVLDGKYYGADGTEVDKNTYLSQCTKKPDNPTPEPEVPEEKCPEDPTNNPVSCSMEIKNEIGCGGKIAEPELCAVIGAQNDEYKKGGNAYCTIYCRKELNLLFQDKVSVLAGRYFKHSIEGKSQIANLSGVIIGTYECGGSIQYNKWKQDYRKANENLIKAWNEYSKWYTVIDNLEENPPTPTYEVCEACSIECSREECTCISGCGIKETEKTSCTTFRWTDTVEYAACDVYRWRSPSSPYSDTTCNSDCDFLAGTSTCSPVSKSASYSSGDFSYTACNCSGGGSCNLDCGTDPNPFLAAAYAALVSARNEIEELLEEIKYCNEPTRVIGDFKLEAEVSAGCGNETTGGYDENITFGRGYRVHIENESYDGNSGGIVCNESSAWTDFCGDCDAKFQGGACQTETLTKYVCDGTPGPGVVCKVESVEVPKNGAVRTIKTAETDHYQNVSFGNQLFTGKVVENPSGPDYLKIEDHAWPVASDRKTGEYDICYDVKNLGERFNDIDGMICNYEVINELTKYDCDDPNDPYHECYECPDGEDCDTCPDGEDCENGGDDDRNDTSLGVYFRPVDLSNLFPNSIYDTKSTNSVYSRRQLGFNWKDKDSVIKDIQNTSSKIWSTKEPELVVTITPESIRKIKQYNNNNEDYINSSSREGQLTCYSNTLLCNSGFINTVLANYVGDDNIIFGTGFNKNRYSKPGGDE